jgi:hypothetical protein
MKKFIIITSIYSPSEAIEAFEKLKNWQLIVVGDQKTPENWNYPNVIYLSTDYQDKMTSPLVKDMPWKTYSRKMAGYIYALENGADIIADTDDDNIPLDDWGVTLNDTNYENIKFSGFVNIYKFFTNEHIWPRGFPLNRILEDTNISFVDPLANTSIGVWQFLADEDPDVDAIYRLTINKAIYFNKRKPINLLPGTICPFNSQNTFFSKECFPLLYLPVFVNFRFTDILRGLVAQPILWAANLTLCFGHATAIQKRNPHDFLIDFESEIPCYLHPEEIIELVNSVISSKNTICDNLRLAYIALEKENIIDKKELILLDAWLNHFS